MVLFLVKGFKICFKGGQIQITKNEQRAFGRILIDTTIYETHETCKHFEK